MSKPPRVVSREPTDRPRRVVLTIIPGAGFTYETGVLLSQLSADFRPIYLGTSYGGRPGQDGLPPGEWFAAPPFPVLTAPSRHRALLAAARTFAATLRVLMTRPVDLVLVVGSPHAAPMLLAARLLGRPTVFVESVTRVDRLSNTGRLIRRLRLARRLFVQWPAARAAAPEAELGTIL